MDFFWPIHSGSEICYRKSEFCRRLFWGVGRRGSIVALSFSWGEVLVKVNQRKKINTSSSVQFACFRVRIAPCLGYAYCTAPDQCRGATSPTSSSNPACRLARHVPLLQEPGAFVNGHVATWLPKGPLVLSFNPCQDLKRKHGGINRCSLWLGNNWHVGTAVWMAQGLFITVHAQPWKWQSRNT